MANGTVGSWLARFYYKQYCQDTAKILGRTFRLISGAILNAKKITLCRVLSHDAKTSSKNVRPSIFSCILAVLFVIRIKLNKQNTF